MKRLDPRETWAMPHSEWVAEQGRKAGSLDEVLEQRGRGSSSSTWTCLNKDRLYSTWCLIQWTGWHGADLDLNPSCVTLGRHPASLSLSSSSVHNMGMAQSRHSIHGRHHYCCYQKTTNIFGITVIWVSEQIKHEWIKLEQTAIHLRWFSCLLAERYEVG